MNLKSVLNKKKELKDSIQCVPTRAHALPPLQSTASEQMALFQIPAFAFTLVVPFDSSGVLSKESTKRHQLGLENKPYKLTQ